MAKTRCTRSRWKSVGYDNLDENRNSHTFQQPTRGSLKPTGGCRGLDANQEPGHDDMAMYLGTRNTEVPIYYHNGTLVLRLLDLD